jgi:predicted DNA-binding ribbon-helix-helix protein
VKFRRREGLVTKSPIVKRSVSLEGHKTSVSLEDKFWTALKEIAVVQKVTTQELILKARSARAGRNLSSSLRLFVLDHYRQQAAAKRR